MKTLLVIYHSQSGNTEMLAQAVAKGVSSESAISLNLKKAFDATLQDLLQADGVIFGTPENFGYMSGALKDFYDRTYYPAEPYQLSLPYALFISAGNDGSGAVREIDRILKGYPMKKVAEPVIVTGEVGEEGLTACEELGQAMATAVAMGAF